MLAGIKDILIISTPSDTPRFQDLLGDGSHFGIQLTYAVQPSPDGLAQAFLIGKEFIGDDECAMILGDNIFYGNGLGYKLMDAVRDAERGYATIFGYYVEDPQRFGIMEFKRENQAAQCATETSGKRNGEMFSGVRVLSVEEKPKVPKSNYAIVGLYFYPGGVSERAARVKPSLRGELEITTLNEMYLRDNLLHAQLLGRGFTWMDAGTVDSLRRATNFVCMVEQYQGMTISSPEEIAYHLGWINDATLDESARHYGKSPYGQHLRAVLEGKVVL